MSGESPSALILCVGLCSLLYKQEERTTHRRKGQGGPWGAPGRSCHWELVPVFRTFGAPFTSTAWHTGRTAAFLSTIFAHYSYVEDWQAFPVESQTVNIRLCEPFGLCHNSPAGPLLHESSQTHKQMAAGCVPTKLNLTTLNCTFHDTLWCYRIGFNFFSL